MLTEAGMCQRLFAFLKTKGYPEDAMALYILGAEQSIGGGKRHCIVDAAILDVSTGMPLVFFEAKSRVDNWEWCVRVMPFVSWISLRLLPMLLTAFCLRCF